MMIGRSTLAATLLLTGASAFAPILAQQPSNLPSRLVPKTCEIENESGRPLTCYDFIVPERRDRTGGPTITLPVMVFRATGPDRRPDPVLEIVGGPGAVAYTQAKHAELWTDKFKDWPWLRGRDLIVFDQRGIGGSRPALECPEVDATRSDWRNLDKVKAAMVACRERLKAEGRDLAGYDTNATVEDIAELRLHLGIAEWNLWGQSYGSRVALTALRRRPDGIRSVILDGPYPPEVAGRHNSNAPTIGLIAAVFEACKRDDDCNRAHPDLPTKWAAAIQRFRANPVKIESDPGANLPKQVFDVNDVLLISLIENQLYTTDGVASIPQLIESLSRGDVSALEEPLAELDLVWFGPYISTGASFTIDCNDHPKSNDAEERARAEREPLYRDWILFGVAVRSCAVWNSTDKGTLDTSPVTSDKPALIVSGAYDVATPAAWAELTAKSLSRGQIVRIGNAAHDASEHECAQAALYLFLENPAAKLELDCAAKSATIKFKVEEAKPERRKKDTKEK